MPEPKSHQWLHEPAFDDILRAEQALKGVAVKTPLFENVEVNEYLSSRLFIKAETAQRTGSFKFRGAYNRMSQLNDGEKAQGVITYSSGNHAQAVACVAHILQTNALIVMPDDAPSNKKARTKALGAQIQYYDREKEDREQVVKDLQLANERVLIPPFEDARVLAGAATAGLELYYQAKALDAVLDAVLVPCGGGGLSAASALVFSKLSPTTKVYAVEPDLFDDTRRSLESGQRVANKKGQTCLCDAIMTDMPGELTFSINRRLLEGVITVSDENVCQAMQYAFEHFKLVVEPGAVVGLAACLHGKINIKGKNIAVIASGGNVDASIFCKAINDNKQS